MVRCSAFMFRRSGFLLYQDWVDRCRLSWCEGNFNLSRRSRTETELRPSFRAIAASDAPPNNLSSAAVHFRWGGRLIAGGMPSARRRRKTAMRVRLIRAAISLSGFVPSNRSCSGLHHLDARRIEIPLSRRLALTLLNEWPVRLAISRSETLPSSLNSA